VRRVERFTLENRRIGIVVSEWNGNITRKLFTAARQTLLEAGLPSSSIVRMNVPGSFELPYGASVLAAKKKIDAVICLGCVIQGETRHFEFISQACANGIMQVSLQYNKPVTFGVLTTDNMKQARERAGGKYGNKGAEAALTVVKLLSAV